MCFFFFFFFFFFFTWCKTRAFSALDQLDNDTCLKVDTYHYFNGFNITVHRT